MGESYNKCTNDIRFYIHFRLPSDTATYDFNYRLQSLVDELEPHCDSLLNVHCDVARNIADELNAKFKEKEGTFILDKELSDMALDYTVFVEIICADESLEKLKSVVAHLISEVTPPAVGEDFDYQVGVDFEPVDGCNNHAFLIGLVHKTQELSAIRTDGVTPLSLYEFDTFKAASKDKTPMDMLDASLDAGMVVFDPPYAVYEDAPHSSKGTAYIYADVNKPALLVGDDGEPVLMARYNDESMNPNGEPSTFTPGWVVLRVIAIPKMSSLDVVAHCLNTHPMQSGFGDGCFSYIFPLLMLSDLNSVKYVTLMGTIFNGFVDGNGATFVSHFDVDGGFFAEVPIKDFYHYLQYIDDLYSVVGDFSAELLKENVKEFVCSDESYNIEHVTKH